MKKRKRRVTLEKKTTPTILRRWTKIWRMVVMKTKMSCSVIIKRACNKT